MKRLIFLLLPFGALTTFAGIKLASPFADHMVLQRDMKVPIWGTAEPGEKINVSFNNQKISAIADANGNWKANLAKLSAGGPFVLIAKGTSSVTLVDIYVGEVWLCSGQSNMDMTVAREDRYWCGVVNEKEEVANANYPTIRVFDVDFTPNADPQKDVKGIWEIVSPTTVGHLSAAAYFFARDLQAKLKVPIGLITSAYGASTAEAWIGKEALKANLKLSYLLDTFQAKLTRYLSDTAAISKYKVAREKYKVAVDQAKAEGKNPSRGPRNPDPVMDQHNPAVLWNGMVAGLVPYAIRGALWYQGESNGPTANIYRDIMATLIEDWRRQWHHGNFPFIFVQLANHEKRINDPIKNDAMVTVRDQQLQNLSIANTAMVVAIDNADPTDYGNIHPKNKQEIGKRLALAAEGLAYGEKIVYSGPLYDKMAIEGNKVRLHFKNVGTGLMAKGDSIAGFAIAGSDKKFVHADAIIDGNTIVVSAPGILSPAAVRYGWAKNPPVNLYNKEGLPTSPFKTD